MTTVARVHKEMGLTPAEFHRHLPAVLRGALVTVDAQTIVARWPGRRLVIDLEPQPQRCLGRLVLPSTRITLTFGGFSEADRRTFLARFDRHYLRGGG